MTQQDQSAKLKQVFSKRVTNQARIVLDSYQKCQSQDWQDPKKLEGLIDASGKLVRYSQRFDMLAQLEAAENLLGVLNNLSHPPVPTEAEKNTLEKFIQGLSDHTRRKSDTHSPSENSASRTFLRTPVFIALNNQEFANRITNQLEFFGFRSVNFEQPEELIAASQQNKPESIVIDVDFGEQDYAGINTIEKLQASHEASIPILYLSSTKGDTETRLRASRSGGEEFFFPTVDPSKLIEKIESYTQPGPQLPYRVLVVDDSRSQARYIDSILKKAGMEPHTITDPFLVLDALEEVQPEIIIMDMYMPGCTGMELARVIRQQERFHSIPIIYLSAEDDINKQLHAMSQGGDDFLTKPIDPKHLVSTLHNRGRRARSLLALMIRDSLSGLYNHTHILNLLEMEIVYARETQKPVAFAMIDLDHFKQINDNYGHPMGDRVIKGLSLYLKQRLRKTDHIGRYGGEEFAVVLPDTSESDAKTIMNEIKERFSALPQTCGNTTFNVTFSCGISTFLGNNTECNATLICDQADKALYQAKKEGRNTVRAFSRSQFIHSNVAGQG